MDTSTLSQKPSLDQAKSNEEVCLFLNENSSYNDWIVTISFYSAYHYVLSKMFPLTVTIGNLSNTYSDFDDYCKRNNISGRKHKVVRGLVDEHLSPIAHIYEKMLDMSWTARYINYRQSDGKKNHAINCLAKIKEFACK